MRPLSWYGFARQSRCGILFVPVIHATTCVRGRPAGSRKDRGHCIEIDRASVKLRFAPGKAGGKEEYSVRPSTDGSVSVGRTLPSRLPLSTLNGRDRLVCAITRTSGKSGRKRTAQGLSAPAPRNYRCLGLSPPLFTRRIASAESKGWRRHPAAYWK